MSTLQRNFIKQQGFEEPAIDGCRSQYGALQFQPRVVGLFVLAGILFQSIDVFAALSILLWVSVLFPRMNPFEAVYNHTFARRPGGKVLTGAPTPRRFAQGMAASFTGAIAACLYCNWTTAAYVIEAFLAVALVALIFGGFCFGSFLFHLLRGNIDHAIATLPWK